MTIQTEFTSWFLHPGTPKAATPPSAGDPAPSTPALSLSKERPTLLVFLRHCGCPFSEKSYLLLRDAARTHPNVDFVTVSHSDEASTHKWQAAVLDTQRQKGGDAGPDPSNLRIVVDDKKEAYAAYGLGAAWPLHVLNPTSLIQVVKLGTVGGGGIGARGTDSGSRWQTSGHFAVKDGVVTWGGPAKRADDVVDVKTGLASLGIKDSA